MHVIEGPGYWIFHCETLDEAATVDEFAGRYGAAELVSLAQPLDVPSVVAANRDEGPTSYAQLLEDSLNPHEKG